MIVKKKLIEVALPLDAINKASAREKQPGIGAHPRGLHLWWARRPLATARAVIFSQMVDDPSGHPELFPTEKAQEKERQRLFKIIEDLVLWENITNEKVLQQARDEIWQSWRRACAENADHPQAKELFDRHKLPAFHDPFAGGGALPLEAQRLGLESYASDLNPVAVLINKAMIEIPSKFSGKPPVHPWGKNTQQKKSDDHWQGNQGLAEDVCYYGQWMRDEAEKRIGHLYPKVEITPEIVKERPDLEKYEGQHRTVIAWIWARTVKSPNPAFAEVDVPLATTFMLSTKKGKEAYVEPVIERGSYRFTVKVGRPKDAEAAKRGTKSGGSGSSFLCLMSDTAMPFEYLRSEAKAGRMKEKLMAVVAKGDRGRVYLAPTVEMESIALSAQPEDTPETDLPKKALGFRVQEYGMLQWRDLFTSRQLVALTTFSDLVQEAREKIVADAKTAGWQDERTGLDDNGNGSKAYADAVGIYLAFAISRLADYNSSIATWKPSGEQVMQTFKRQAIPMTWDFPESNVMGQSAICWEKAVKYTADNLLATASQYITSLGFADQCEASIGSASLGKVISTDPPYYDNIGYADLSDFFYVWLRRSMRSVFPNLFATLAVPKSEELVATPYRHGSTGQAETFFLEGMTQVMHRLAEQTHPAFPVTIYYAFKQAESDGADGMTNTGWDTFLAAVIKAGFAISGTWPMRTELANRMISSGTNALASSIVLVCRQQTENAPIVTRGEFVTELKAELPRGLAHLQRENIAPVDLAQASIGPGMAVFTRYAKVIDADGKPLSVGQALALINQTLDEALAEQEGDFDADSRWALAWFEQMGFAGGEFGVANVLATAKNTSVQGLVDAGIIDSGRGKVRLWTPNELPDDWDPDKDIRLTSWEMVHHLIRILEADGESAASKIMAKLGSKAEIARELCYRLYNLCERKKRATEALSYNGLVQSWPEIVRLSQEGGRPRDEQTDLFDDNEE
jgi:putative DNA methylase